MKFYEVKRKESEDKYTVVEWWDSLDKAKKAVKEYVGKGAIAIYETTIEVLSDGHVKCSSEIVERM